MKKIAFSFAVLLLCSAAFAQKAEYTIPFDIMIRDSVKLQNEIAAKLDSIKAIQSAPSAPKNLFIPIETYKPGTTIDLLSLEGKEAEITIKRIPYKRFVLATNSQDFAITYSKYSFKFYYSVDKAGNLKIRIVPIEKKDETLLPKTTAVISITDDAVVLSLRAVTIDDVNNGLGWSILANVAALK